MGAVAHTALSRSKLLEAFADCGRVDLSCQAAGVARRTHYDWLDNDPEYKELWEQARRQAADRLESEAWRRAMDGCEVPVYQMGSMVGTRREYSDRLMELLLKGHKPDRYKDRVEHSGQIDFGVALAEGLREKRMKRQQAIDTTAVEE